MSEAENNNQKFNGIVIIPLLMAVALAAGLFLGTFFIKDGGFADPVQENTNKFNTILEFIEDNYVDSVDHDLLIESSIEGMIKKLDPHSAYIPARDLAEVNEQLEGNFGGIGIRFLIHHDTLVATHVLKGSPAEQAGMKAGDRILEVDDTVIANAGLSNERVMELLKGEVGTKVEVKIYRKGETQKLSLTRGQIPISSIDAYLMLNDEVGFIKLNSFTFSAGEEFNAAASDLKSRGMKKLILI
ncbi:MAG: PDZ domain-containing protein [Crocinitomicaceae bacterium]|nr:PDZ domain-containing protein [Crocinitomicaceae bacterium]